MLRYSGRLPRISFLSQILLAEINREYAQCCTEPYVHQNYTMCGQVINVAGLELEVRSSGRSIKNSITSCDLQPVPCHTKTSPYTWDPLLGINTDLLFLFINAVFYCGLLAAVEWGYVAKAKAFLQSLRKRDQSHGWADGTEKELDEVTKEKAPVDNRMS